MTGTQFGSFILGLIVVAIVVAIVVGRRALVDYRHVIPHDTVAPV